VSFGSIAASFKVPERLLSFCVALNADWQRAA
jgi:hypothetical protein